jgi:hypothetical protein
VRSAPARGYLSLRQVEAAVTGDAPRCVVRGVETVGRDRSLVVSDRTAQLIRVVMHVGPLLSRSVAVGAAVEARPATVLTDTVVSGAVRDAVCPVVGGTIAACVLIATTEFISSTFDDAAAVALAYPCALDALWRHDQGAEPLSSQVFVTSRVRGMRRPVAPLLHVVAVAQPHALRGLAAPLNGAGHAITYLGEMLGPRPIGCTGSRAQGRGIGCGPGRRGRGPTVRQH